jgi:FKBP-type peptidyl-prolyl cis-trans isomerase
MMPVKISYFGLTVLLLAALLNSSCRKDYEKIDKERIEKYLQSKGLSAQTTPSGLYYVVINEGSGERPSSSSTISVQYKGYFLDDKTFDASDSVQFSLTQVIEGWVEGLQLIKEGGSIRLFLPSALAYGSNGNGTIPANEPLAFDIGLKRIDAVDLSNRREIRSYAAKKGLKLDSLSSGLYYLIENPGSGSNPAANAQVTVNYKGYFSDDKVFDGTTATFSLFNVIPGWQLGIPLLKKGGKGKLFVPARLAYGSKGSGKIPPNKVTIFDVELIDF